MPIKQHNKRDIRRFFNAIEKASQYIVNQPNAAWQVFRDSNSKLLDELNQLALQIR